MIPAVDDCSILATTNNSYYVFVGADGKEYKQVPASNDPSLNKVIKDIEDGYVYNPAFDPSYLDVYKDQTDLIFPLKQGAKPKTKYPSRW